MTTHERRWTTILVVLLCASPAWAQQNQGDGQANPPAQQTVTPDTRPLTGIESLGLGSLAGERSYLQPGFLVAQTAQSNALYQPGGQAGFDAVTILAGNLALQGLTRRNQFSLSYQGGGIIYETDSQLDSTYHLFGFSDSLSFRRATFTITDRFSYLPGFYGGLGGLAYGGAFNLGGIGTLPGLNTGFTPQRGILTNAAGYGNVALAQLEYLPTARSSVTLAAGFQSLDSSQQGYTSFNSMIAQAGYNRNLTSRDTIAVFYSASLFHYKGISEDINSQAVVFSYGRRVTNRLALKLFGGPELFAITVPGHTQTSTTGYGGVQLTYHWPRTELSIDYFKGITGGAGTLAGANTNAVNATLSRQLSTKWSGNLGSGYYFNSGLARPGSAATQQMFNYWHGTFSVARTLGRYARVTFLYGLQTQNSNEPFSLGSGTGKSVLNNVFGVTLNFNYRPIGI